MKIPATLEMIIIMTIGGNLAFELTEGRHKEFHIFNTPDFLE